MAERPLLAETLPSGVGPNATLVNLFKAREADMLAAVLNWLRQHIYWFSAATLHVRTVVLNLMKSLTDLKTDH